MASTKSKLNPFAAEFVPGGTHTSSSRSAALPAAASRASQQQEPDAAAVLFDIKELPMEMLSCIMASLAGCNHDLSSCLMASQQLQAAVRAARVTYALTEPQQQLLSNPANSCKLDELVQALTKYMPGMAGAAAAARDTSGASPLFVASEAGRAAAVEVLLRAGADPLVGNTAGETALYIAALRGHLPVVEVLLKHLSAAGVDWMQAGLYGDAWTPLMAAAVANRVDVALCLLRAANGFTAAGNKLQQLQQRDSSKQLGKNVRVAGQVVDTAGDTWADVARRHGHSVALRELLQQC
ncbi:hypothetical protein OEZ86_007770 [Tetradesmus obliquus]|nr:hypothetical protein OEZ86_007770 [Tetradesmus obliquus]